ncbi:hypothetical protein BJY04DRAFT_221447 [Aspergillus karnatakaensis]|uniref:fungal specific transcription factor domain-containing protein n=1 Tax=Aspergillus karnatakaensis TaxID=1810916 RepID=UPI003CCDFC3F
MFSTAIYKRLDSFGAHVSRKEDMGILTPNEVGEKISEMLKSDEACHKGQARKWDLACNYLGIAIRTAHCMGSNRNTNGLSSGILDPQSSYRTWWTLYSLESEFCIEYEKPLSIRERDAKAPYTRKIPVTTIPVSS